jgi:hypothetical protein
MSKNKFISFRSQILNRKRPEGLIRIYVTLLYFTLNEVGCEGIKWIEVAQDRFQQRREFCEECDEISGSVTVKFSSHLR